MKNKIPNTTKRNKFLLTYGNQTDSETLKEILFAQQLQLTKLEKIRSNTSILAWWLVAIPLILAIILVVLGILN